MLEKIEIRVKGTLFVMIDESDKRRIKGGNSVKVAAEKLFELESQANVNRDFCLYLDDTAHTVKVVQ